MEWYYAQGDNQVGPLTQDEFDGLVTSGAIKNSTMVWNAEMRDWQSYGAVFGVSPGSTVSPPVLNMPAADSNRIWREGRDLVFVKDTALPCRCVKCNQPAEGGLIDRKLSYYPSWVNLLILLNLLIMLIVAACISKKAIVEVPVCELHRAQLKQGIMMSWLFCLGGIAMVFVAIWMSLGWLAIAGVFSLIIGIVFGMTRGRLVYATKIDDTYVWMRGAGAAYLDELSD
ncbi:MAG: DUF4339 domain-containing protein [Opitutaceae bacterium]